MSISDLQSVIDWTEALVQLALMVALLIIIATIIGLVLVMAVVASVKTWREAA